VTPMLHGLYVVTEDRRHTGGTLPEKVRAALEGGARVVQYRDKSADHRRRLDEAAALADLCRKHGALFLINDDVDLALAAGADGVHLGRDDQDLRNARRQLSAGSIIGISCYNDLELARQAAGLGADYIAFGSFFPSPTKPRAVRAKPELLRQARRELSLPMVAIGGISPENGAALVRAGATMLAAVSAVFAAPDVTAAARAFAPCFTPAEETQHDRRT